MLDAFKKLVEIAALLRSQEGCPWDKSRTIPNLENDLLEEVEEIVMAIQNEDYSNLKEEIGDVFYTLILMTRIAEEQGHFTMKEVLEGVGEKLIRRHTWVFGEDQASTPEEALELWKKNKLKE